MLCWIGLVLICCHCELFNNNGSGLVLICLLSGTKLHVAITWEGFQTADLNYLTLYTLYTEKKKAEENLSVLEYV